MRRDRKEQTRGAWVYAAAIGGVLVVLLLWWRWDDITGRVEVGSEEPVTAAETVVDEGAPDLPVDAPPPSRSAAESAWTALTGSAPVWPGDPNVPGDCAEVEADLARICAALDSRDYAVAAVSAGGTCALVSEVAGALAQRPPQPSLELRDYPTILANVYHLFRVSGRQRMDVMRRVLREEQDLAEPMALALYRWAVSRETCARSGNTAIRRETLYTYSGYLFGTMGGQAYLRRRSPRVEALASFYALLAIDQAERDGNNPLGLDVLPEIGRARELVGSQDFVFGDRYIELIKDIEHRRATRGGG